MRLKIKHSAMALALCAVATLAACSGATGSPLNVIVLRYAHGNPSEHAEQQSQPSLALASSQPGVVDDVGIEVWRDSAASAKFDESACAGIISPGEANGGPVLVSDSTSMVDRTYRALAPGSCAITISAKGYQPATVPVVVTR
jgi:hypothetical protein